MAICKRCGIEFEVEPGGPVTVDGWYGSFEVRWDQGRRIIFGPYCESCKEIERSPTRSYEDALLQAGIPREWAEDELAAEERNRNLKE